MGMGSGLAAKVRAGELAVGTWFNIPHVIAAETMAQGGFDFLLIDGEHSPIHPDLLADLLPATELRGCPAVYRVRANREDLIKAALDAGAAGIMVPMVSSSGDAERAVRAAKYPPEGQRGIGPWRASNYYTDFPAYFAGANEATLVILQIESAEAVKNIKEIAAVPGADCLFVGPFDLAGSMGLPVGVPHPELTAAIGKIAAAAKRAKKAAGIDVGSLDSLPGYVEVGFSVFTHGADMGYLIEGARAVSAAFRQRAAGGER